MAEMERDNHPDPPDAGQPMNGRLEHAEVRYERTDANFRWVLGILTGGVLLGAFILYVVLAFFHYYGSYQTAIKESAFPLAPAPADALPAEPRLEQVDRLAGVQRVNVATQELEKEKVLNSYGPTDEKGYVHIPVDRAIDSLASKTSAAKTSGPGRKANGLVDSGASNSGRVFREKPAW
jgi:hypothetical protein